VRTHFQHTLDRFAAAILAALPEGYPLPDDALRHQLRTRSHPRALASEIDNTIWHMETLRRFHGTHTETGIVWTLTIAGRAWQEQNP